MVQAQVKDLTLEEFLKLPETEPASEYIDGQIFPKTMSQGKHSRIQGELVSAINGVIRTKKIACAFPELRCTFGDHSTVPDIAVLIWDRIPREQSGEVADAFFLAPDWTIEILSPTQSQTKVIKNILHCLSHGTQIGWLIDPAEKTVFVYRPKQEFELFDQPEMLIPAPSFAKEFSLTAEDLFGWLFL